MRFTPAPIDFDTDGFADYEPETPALSHCARCGRYMPRYSTMPQCMACQEFLAKREENLQRWGLRPKGVNIEIRRVA